MTPELTEAPPCNICAEVGDRVLKEVPVSRENIEEIEGGMLDLPQVEVPLEHRFAPGVYWREVVMPKDTYVLGHEHKTEHFNVVLSGRAKVFMEGRLHEVVAPAVFVSKPGVRKFLYIEEEMRWGTIHPTNETDLQKLEDLLIVKSDTFLGHQALHDLEQLKIAMNGGDPCLG